MKSEVVHGIKEDGVLLAFWHAEALQIAHDLIAEKLGVSLFF